METGLYLSKVNLELWILLLNYFLSMEPISKITQIRNTVACR